MYFCIRDDDTSFFTTPEALESAYEGIRGGPISLAVIPFCRAGTSAFVPERFQKRWAVHSLHENKFLVNYLRHEVAHGRYEIMLHGFHHDEPDGYEFGKRRDDPELLERVSRGRKYLEDLLGTQIRVFVPPSNGLSRYGLDAIRGSGLHLGGAAGVRGGWNRLSPTTWKTGLRLRQWRLDGRPGVPWVLDMGDHREIPGNPVTPSSRLEQNEAIFDAARAVDGAFCVATHYWEFSALSSHPGEPEVGQQLRRLVERALQDKNVIWQSVGDTISKCRPLT